MTEKEIMSLKPGVELDTYVAEMMGYKFIKDHEEYMETKAILKLALQCEVWHGSPPNYSTDMNKAMKVIKFMGKNEYYFQSNSYCGGMFDVCFSLAYNIDSEFKVYNCALAEGICKAALLAMRGQE